MILEHAAKVGEVAADDVPPTASPIPHANVFREDVPEPSLPGRRGAAQRARARGRPVPGAADHGDGLVTELCDRTGTELSAAARRRRGQRRPRSWRRRWRGSRRSTSGSARSSRRRPQLARERAEELDVYLATGAPQSPAAGIPVALKDVLTTNGIRTTCGSKILETYVPPVRRHRVDAALGRRRRARRARRTATSSRWARRTRTPRSGRSTTRGTSTASRAARAAGAPPPSPPGEAVWALGTDTGGSVRQPASLCGVVGLKPTYGRISRYGLIAFASSLDTVGTFTRSVADAAALLGVLAGHDPRDATSLEAPVPDYAAGLDRGVAGLRVGVVTEAFGEGVEPGVADGVRRGDRSARGAGRRGRGGLAPARRVRALGVLPDRAERGVVEPRPLRRRPLRATARRGSTPTRSR